jgi:hypothetical protein
VDQTAWQLSLSFRRGLSRLSLFVFPISLGLLTKSTH